MKFSDLKKIINRMNEKQLAQPVVVFEEDDEQGKEIDYHEKSTTSFYWLDGDCYGDRKECLSWIKSNKLEFPDDDISIEDFTCIPKGTVTLHI